MTTLHNIAITAIAVLAFGHLVSWFYSRAEGAHGEWQTLRIVTVLVLAFCIMILINT